MNAAPIHPLLPQFARLAATLATTLATGCALAIGSDARAQFHRIDPLGGSSSSVLAISNHYGAAVVGGWGGTADGAAHGVWYLNQGLVDVGTIGGAYSAVLGVSEGGTYLAGWGSVHPTDFSLTHAVRWLRYGPALDLGTLGGCCSMAYDINSSGTVVVGSSTPASGGNRAFRWVEGSGMSSLGTLGGWSSAHGVDGSGSIVVGTSDLADGTGSHRAFRWTQGSGMTSLGTLGGSSSSAEAISANGQFIVGYSDDGEGYQRPFLWHAKSGMTALPMPPGYSGYASSVGYATYGWQGSGPFIAVGGRVHDPSGQQRAAIWREDLGMIDLTALLQARGTLPSGWTVLREVTAISRDGRSIGGYGVFNGQMRGFMIEGLSFAGIGCEGDVDLDSEVSARDITVILSNWGPNPVEARADINGDNRVDGIDLSIVLGNWGDCTG
jgi:probable HAF family extracellular repeat protein